MSDDLLNSLTADLKPVSRWYVERRLLIGIGVGMAVSVVLVFLTLGPRKDLAAYDDVIQGQSGMAALNRTPQGEPRYFPMAFVDKYVGTMLGTMIIADDQSSAPTVKKMFMPSATHGSQPARK